jgi:hypothetical protein
VRQLPEPSTALSLGHLAYRQLRSQNSMGQKSPYTLFPSGLLSLPPYGVHLFPFFLVPCGRHLNADL